jgi:hypothetical protein
MMNKTLGATFALAALFAACSIVAADAPDEVPFQEGKEPPPCKPGEGWCLVTKPATYKIVSK